MSLLAPEFAILARLSNSGVDDCEAHDIHILVAGIKGCLSCFVSNYGARYLEAVGTLFPFGCGRG
jgi:hypothetical protein